jgi:hypothetical protein
MKQRPDGILQPEFGKLYRALRDGTLDRNMFVTEFKRAGTRVYNEGYKKGALDANRDEIIELRKTLLKLIKEKLGNL